MDIRSQIELFHLMFLKSFLTHQDKSLIALKGGCNLRFFHGSSRYSEDIDFDVTTVSKETLKKRVDKVLSSQALLNSLAARQIRILNFSSPKQTETVQRWKVAISARGLTIPTKIEFSRRSSAHVGAIFEPVDQEITALYKLSPILLAHYDAEYAICQKIEALAGRAETQARDIFDLDLLFSRNRGIKGACSPELLNAAISSAMSIDFDQFKGQVVEFLTDDHRAYFSNEETWQSLQDKVIARLESFAS